MNHSAIPRHGATSTTAHEARAGGKSYAVIASLGSGRMGDLLLAARRDGSGIRRLSVIKQLRRTLGMDASFREMFVREGRIASRLRHPNVVSTHDVGQHEGALYIAMEYLEGQTLRSLVAAMGQASYVGDPLLWVRVVSDVLAGLHYAHELRGDGNAPLGLVHRDVSPHNVFVTYEGRVVLIDFGSAKLTAEASRVDSGSLMGRLGYMSPEYLAGYPSDRRADVFSAGIVLWELLAERPLPHNGVLSPTIHPKIPHLSTVMPDLDPRLAAIVAKAVEVDPDRRYPTAAAMRDALQAYADAVGRMLRRDELTSMMATLFDEERTRFADDVRERLARLDASASGRHDVADEEAPRSGEKRRLELVDSDEEMPEGALSLDDFVVLSITDIVPSDAPETRVVPSRGLEADDEVSSSDVLESVGDLVDAVSVPAGPDTKPPTHDGLLGEDEEDDDDSADLATRASALPTRAVLEVETLPALPASPVGISLAWPFDSGSLLDLPVSVASMIELPAPPLSIADLLSRASGLDVPISVMSTDDLTRATPLPRTHVLTVDIDPTIYLGTLDGARRRPRWLSVGGVLVELGVGATMVLDDVRPEL